jgi:hypothetical protein
MLSESTQQALHNLIAEDNIECDVRLPDNKLVKGILVNVERYHYVIELTPSTILTINTSTSDLTLLVWAQGVIKAKIRVYE